MGADFVSLIPSSDVHVSYGHVYDIKIRLIGLVDTGLSHIWESINYASNFTIEESNRKAEHVCNALKQMVASAGDDESEKTKILKGVYYFVAHSDCDGSFYSDECEYIALALKELNKQEEGEDGVIENLITVFDDAYNGDGEVQIY